MKIHISNFHLVAIALATIPIILIVRIIVVYAVNIPYADAWDLWIDAAVYQVPWTAEAFVNELWRLSNEHRIFIPKFFTIPFAYVTQGNSVLQIYVNLLTLVFILLVLIALYRRVATSNYHLVLGAAFSTLIFTLAAGSRWIDPRPLPNYVAILAFLLALYVVSVWKVRWRTLIVVALLLVIASLSYSTGNITWFVMLPLLLVAGYRNLKYYLFWSIIASMVLVPYTADLLSTFQLSSANVANFSFLQWVGYIFAFIGSPLSTELRAGPQHEAILLGIFGCVSLAWLGVTLLMFSTVKAKHILPWLTIVMWVVLNGAQAGLARAGLSGANGARSERYVIYGSLFWCCVAVLIALLLTEASIKQAKLRRIADIFAILLIFALGVMHISANTATTMSPQLLDYHNRMTASRDCLNRLDLNEVCMRTLHPDVIWLRLLMPQVMASTPSFFEPETSFPLNIAIIDTPQPEYVTQTSITIENEQYLAIFQHPTSTITWRFDIPDATEVMFNAILWVEKPDSRTPPGDGVVFELLVQQSEQNYELMHYRMTPTDFEDRRAVQVDLSNFAGQTIDLRFRTLIGEDENANGLYDWAYWINPLIVTEQGQVVTPQLPAYLLPRRTALNRNGAPLEVEYQPIVVEGIPYSAIEHRSSEFATWTFAIPANTVASFSVGAWIDEDRASPQDRLLFEVFLFVDDKQVSVSRILGRAVEAAPQFIQFDIPHDLGNRFEIVLKMSTVLPNGEISSYDGFSPSGYWLSPTLTAFVVE